MLNKETESNLDKELLEMMFKKIRGAENKNIKTQEYDDSAMVDRITRFIELKVKAK